jgi:hypothetical protein
MSGISTSNLSSIYKQIPTVNNCKTLNFETQYDKMYNTKQCNKVNMTTVPMMSSNMNSNMTGGFMNKKYPL